MQQFSFAEENALTPDQVASGMLELLQEKEYPCGTVREITTHGMRVIPEWNIPPPDGAGTGQELDAADMMKAMLAPIEEKLAKEKGASKL